MKKCHYYPGCTLKEKATNLDDSTREAMKVLDIELVEPEGWTCCGAEYPLTEEKIVGMAAPLRILRQVQMEGGDKVVTTCAFCYAVLKRANKDILDDPIKHKRMNAYLKDDIKIDPLTKEKTTGFASYDGDVAVIHLLDYLVNMVDEKEIRSKIKRNLKGLKVAPYYGCRLLRPNKEVGIDDPENPQIFEYFLKTMGCDVVDFPFKQECCGSYISVSLPDAATEASYQVLRNAKASGADVMTLSCPLCYYNLDTRQNRIREKFPDFTGMPILFFTQLLAWAFGVDESVLGFDQHFTNPEPILVKASAAEVTP